MHRHRRRRETQPAGANPWSPSGYGRLAMLWDDCLLTCLVRRFSTTKSTRRCWSWTRPFAKVYDC